MDAGGEVAQLGDAGPGLLERHLPQLGGALRVRRRLALRELEREHGAHELLLRAVVQVAGEAGAGGVGGLDDAPARRAQLLRARLGDVAVARRLRRLEVLLDVGPRGDRPRAVGQLERRRRVRDPHDRPVLAHEPVLAVLQAPAASRARVSGQSSVG